MPRIDPLEPPYDAEAGEQLAAMMPPGTPPIALFRTFAKNLPMTRAMRGWGSYELSKELSLSLRERVTRPSGRAEPANIVLSAISTRAVLGSAASSIAAFGACISR